MILTLKRIAKRATYTIGHLYVDGVLFCDTIEDTDRGLTQEMKLWYIQQKKVKGKTAIPKGLYTVSMKVVSPRFGKVMPRLLNVPGFDGILIHTGNTAEDTEGCIIVGRNKVKGNVTESRATFNELLPLLQAASDAGEDIKISII